MTRPHLGSSKLVLLPIIEQCEGLLLAFARAETDESVLRQSRQNVEEPLRAKTARRKFSAVRLVER